MQPHRVALLIAALCFCLPNSTRADEAGLEFFEKRIRPVLVKRCYECHSAGKKRQGGLLLDSRAGIRKGGDTGPAVVPGKADESILLAAIRYEDLEMPPKGKLPAATVRNFERWIRIGAPDPREGEVASVETDAPSVEEGRSYWAFRPVADPEAPKVKASGWPRSDIDRFLLSRMEAQSLAPAADASPEVLLRRLTFDLIGLPPTPGEIDAFLADVKEDRKAAVEKVVDRLLESPRFGERWGRHWLDVVRFAESSGGGRTRIFDHAWRYRDYVISSFNQDKPFDRFAQEHIAGDLLPSDSLQEARENLTATSFLAIAPTNYELQDKTLLDMEVVDEQLTTTVRGFLGLTIGCSRCHDHKFDPIPMRDYYALAGIFKSTRSLDHANVSNPVMRELPMDQEQQKLAQAFSEKSDPLKKEIAQLEALLKVLDGGKRPGRLTLLQLRGVTADESGESAAQDGTGFKPGTVKRTGSWASSSGIPGFVGDTYHHSSQAKAKVEYSFPLAKPAKLEVRLSFSSYPNRASNVPVTIHHAGGETVKRVNMKKKPTIDGSFVSLGAFDFSELAVVVVGCAGVDGVVIADAVQLLPFEKTNTKTPLSSLVGATGDAEPEATREKRLAEKTKTEAKLKTLRADLKKIQKDAPSAAPVVMSVREGEKPDDCPLCIRGNVHNPGATIPRGFLSVISGDDVVKIPDGASGRLELARWITRPDNPLTARVFVNRTWHWLFGAGLVRSVDNFGRMGEPPSHPELLDHLSTKFVQDGWSVKKLIRRIVLSRSYQLASERAPDARQLDPENRLLSHAPRKRLDAESIRDAILAVSGQLDLTPGGSTIKPGSKTEFGYRFNEATLDGRRRSVYVPVFRNTLLDLFEVFDFADPNLVVGRRTSSTLPTQALYLMNSPWVADQSRHAASRLLAQESSHEERIATAHRMFLGRLPRPGEQQLAEDFLRRADPDEERLAAWSQLCQALYSSVDFRYVR